MTIDGKPARLDRRQAGLRALGDLEGGQAGHDASLREAELSGSVLLVEDEESLASLVEAYLAQEGFSVVVGRHRARRRCARSSASRSGSSSST